MKLKKEDSTQTAELVIQQDQQGGSLKGYPETEMCGLCKEECCRRQPGHSLPSEFDSAEAVGAAVESGKYTIVLLLDSQIMARVGRAHYKEPDRKRGCIFLNSNGCELPFSDRPYGCRMLRPRERDGEHCEPKGIQIEEAAKMWEQSGYLPPIWASLQNVFKR